MTRTNVNATRLGRVKIDDGFDAGFGILASSSLFATLTYLILIHDDAKLFCGP